MAVVSGIYSSNLQWNKTPCIWQGTNRQSCHQTVWGRAKPVKSTVNLITKLKQNPQTPCPPPPAKEKKYKEENQTRYNEIYLIHHNFLKSIYGMASEYPLQLSGLNVYFDMLYSLNVTPLSLYAANYTSTWTAHCMQNTSPKWLLAHHSFPLLPFSSVISLYYITVPSLGFSLILAKNARAPVSQAKI